MQDKYINPGDVLEHPVPSDINEQIERELAEYAASDALAEDISFLKNESQCNGIIVPDDDALMEQLLAAQRDYIRNRLECETNGHQFTEYADGENGSGTLDCDHCGFSFDYQW